MIVPPVRGDLKLMSIGFFLDDNEPVMWRGPMLHRALEQFLTDVHWGELDTLVVDMPPGTGDVSISLGQLLPRAEAVVVTTPQPLAQEVAARAATMAQQDEHAAARRGREHERRGLRQRRRRALAEELERAAARHGAARRGAARVRRRAASRSSRASPTRRRRARSRRSRSDRRDQARAGRRDREVPAASSPRGSRSAAESGAGARRTSRPARSPCRRLGGAGRSSVANARCWSGRGGIASAAQAARRPWFSRFPVGAIASLPELGRVAAESRRGYAFVTKVRRPPR